MVYRRIKVLPVHPKYHHQSHSRRIKFTFSKPWEELKKGCVRFGIGWENAAGEVPNNYDVVVRSHLCLFKKLYMLHFHGGEDAVVA